jgi:hypothetical protein
VVVAAAVRRAAWPVAAAAAAAVLVALALHGRRPESGLARFEAAGVMTAPAPERAREVRVSAGARAAVLRRAADGRWARLDGEGAGDPTEAVERGLRFLHVSAPQRVLERDELGPGSAAEFGLAPPRYVVAVRGAAGETFTIDFGGFNAQGFAQYARVAGRDAVVLLPRFVGESWPALAGAP